MVTASNMVVFRKHAGDFMKDIVAGVDRLLNAGIAVRGAFR